MSTGAEVRKILGMNPHQFKLKFAVFKRQTQVAVTQTHLFLNVTFDAGLNISRNNG
jgi:hypothetical protein